MTGTITTFDKAIAAFLAPLVVTATKYIGELIGVSVTVDVEEWLMAAVVAAVAAAVTYYKRNGAATTHPGPAQSLVANK